VLWPLKNEWCVEIREEPSYPTTTSNRNTKMRRKEILRELSPTVPSPNKIIDNIMPMRMIGTVQKVISRYTDYGGLLHVFLTGHKNNILSHQSLCTKTFSVISLLQVLGRLVVLVLVTGTVIVTVVWWVVVCSGIHRNNVTSIMAMFNIPKWLSRR